MCVRWRAPRRRSAESGVRLVEGIQRRERQITATRHNSRPARRPPRNGNGNESTTSPMKGASPPTPRHDGRGRTNRPSPLAAAQRSSATLRFCTCFENRRASGGPPSPDRVVRRASARRSARPPQDAQESHQRIKNLRGLTEGEGNGAFCGRFAVRCGSLAWSAGIATCPAPDSADDPRLGQTWSLVATSGW